MFLIDKSLVKFIFFFLINLWSNVYFSSWWIFGKMYIFLRDNSLVKRIFFLLINIWCILNLCAVKQELVLNFHCVLALSLIFSWVWYLVCFWFPIKCNKDRNWSWLSSVILDAQSRNMSWFVQVDLKRQELVLAFGAN